MRDKVLVLATSFFSSSVSFMLSNGEATPLLSATAVMAWGAGYLAWSWKETD